MPLFFRESNSNIITGVWDISETAGQLSARLSPAAKPPSAIQVPLKQLHWLAVRVLLNELIGAGTHQVLTADAFGKPLLPGTGWNISLSHSHQRVAVAASRTVPVGVDIERIDSKVNRIASKFMSGNELSFAGSKPQSELLHVYWGAKEAMYKLEGRKGLVFKKQLHVAPFVYTGQGELNGEIGLEGALLDVRLRYRELDGYMLVLAAF